MGSNTESEIVFGTREDWSLTSERYNYMTAYRDDVAPGYVVIVVWQREPIWHEARASWRGGGFSRVLRRIKMDRPDPDYRFDLCITTRLSTYTAPPITNTLSTLSYKTIDAPPSLVAAWYPFLVVDSDNQMSYACRTEHLATCLRMQLTLCLDLVRAGLTAPDTQNK